MRNKKGQYAFTSAILSAKFMSCFSATGGVAPRPSPGLRPWTPLGDFRPPDPLNFAPNLSHLATPLHQSYAQYYISTHRHSILHEQPENHASLCQKLVLGDAIYTLPSAIRKLGGQRSSLAPLHLNLGASAPSAPQLVPPLVRCLES